MWLADCIQARKFLQIDSTSPLCMQWNPSTQLEPTNDSKTLHRNEGCFATMYEYISLKKSVEKQPGQ